MITDEMRDKLVKIAVDVRKKAYAPYSNYSVGAALLTESGKTYDGVNIENAAYPATICAERVAIVKAVSDGEMKFDAIAVATINGGTPCGTCRQVMAEFGLDTLVIITNNDGVIVEEISVAGLLPGAFQPEDLESKQ